MSRPVPPLPSLGDLLRLYKLSTRKALSQNFIMDGNVTAKIARRALAPHANAGTTTVVEVGPGPGGLTRAALDAGVCSVVAIEKDTRFRGSLAGLAEAVSPRLTVHYADATQVDLTAIAQDAPADVALVGNLPFNVASHLVIKWLADASAGSGVFACPGSASMSLMFQLEVAERLTAQHGDPRFSRLSIMAGMYTDAQLVYNLPPSVFVPPPKVSAGLVTFVPKPRDVLAAAPPFPVLEDVTRVAFSQRRKTLRNATKSHPVLAAAVASVDGGAMAGLRAQALSLPQWASLANFVAADAAT